MDSGSASATTFTSAEEWVPLSEAVISEDGTIPIKIVAPGWSKNRRYYSESVLRAAAHLYRAGTQMFWNHPGPQSQREQPGGDLNALAGVTVEDAVYRDDEKYGPGLYTRSRPLSPYRERISEIIALAQNGVSPIGISHRVSGKQAPGEAEGKRGMIVEAIIDPATDPAKYQPITVDFVARPAAGGAPLAEGEEDLTMTDTITEEIVSTRIAEAIAPFKEQIAAKDAEITTLKEEAEAKDATIITLKTKGVLLRAKELLAELLGEAEITAPSREKLEKAIPEPTLKEDLSFDEAEYKKIIGTAIGDEIAYLKKIAEANAGTGVPGSDTGDSLADIRELHRLTGRR